jgi:hypothetical protein
LVDSVTYSGTTPSISRNRPTDVTGAATNAQFVNSALGDAYGSHLAPTNPADLANPGAFPAAAVPEPASWAMMILGMGLVGTVSRRRRRRIAFA